MPKLQILERKILERNIYKGRFSNETIGQVQKVLANPAPTPTREDKPLDRDRLTAGLILASTERPKLGKATS